MGGGLVQFLYHHTAAIILVVVCLSTQARLFETYEGFGVIFEGDFAEMCATLFGISFKFCTILLLMASQKV